MRWKRVVKSQFHCFPRRILLHEHDNGASVWCLIKDLGRDHALFVGANHPFNIDVSRDDSRAHRLRGNCVYVVDTIDVDFAFFNVKNSEYANNVKGGWRYYQTSSHQRQMPMWFRPIAAYPIFEQEPGE